VIALGMGLDGLSTRVLSLSREGGADLCGTATWDGERGRAANGG
jgi:hypothetical protein